MNIWITSDFHFNHNKPFIWKARGFNSIDEMNAEIVKRHNEVVAPEDIVYVLGDLCMGADLEKNKQLIESLNGRLRILYGNHDTIKRKDMYLDCENVEVCLGYATVLPYKKYNFYLSHYPTITANYDSDKPLKAQVPSICGHTHADFWDIDIDKGIIFHAEVDTNNCYPWNLDDIIEKLKEVKN